MAEPATVRVGPCSRFMWSGASGAMVKLLVRPSWLPRAWAVRVYVPALVNFRLLKVATPLTAKTDVTLSLVKEPGPLAVRVTFLVLSVGRPNSSAMSNTIGAKVLPAVVLTASWPVSTSNWLPWARTGLVAEVARLSSTPLTIASDCTPVKSSLIWPCVSASK